MTQLLVDTGPLVALLNRRDRHHVWVREILDTVEPPVFATVPMAFADACLVRMSELQDTRVILTLDGDFRVYRRNRRQVIPIITPGTDTGE